MPPKEKLKVFPSSYKPSKYDVVLGKGEENSIFGSYVDERYKEYYHAKVRDRSGIINDTYLKVLEAGGHFLKQDDNGAQCYRQISRMNARWKVTHALRKRWALKQPAKPKRKVAEIEKTRFKERSKREYQSSSSKKSERESKTNSKKNKREKVVTTKTGRKSIRTKRLDRATESSDEEVAVGMPAGFVRKRPQNICKPRKKPKLSPETQEDSSPLSRKDKPMASGRRGLPMGGLQMLAAHRQIVLAALQNEKGQQLFTSAVETPAPQEVPKVAPPLGDKEIERKTVPAPVRRFQAAEAPIPNNFQASWASAGGRKETPAFLQNESRNYAQQSFAAPLPPPVRKIQPFAAPLPPPVRKIDYRLQDPYAGEKDKTRPSSFPVGNRSPCPPVEKEEEEDDDRVSCWGSWQ